MHNSRSGFTFIELAIVIAVIGLIIGGITIGRDIVRNAELQSIISDVNKYTKAAQLFKEKYKEFPGDFSGATAIWGTDPNGCPPSDNSVPKTATCNGDGNGFIVDARVASVINDAQYWEAVRVWQHLANAELIEGKYTGAGYGGTLSLSPGLNMPKSKMPGNTFNFFYAAPGIPSGNTTVFNANYRHIIVFGNADGLIVESGALNPSLTGAEALAIDQKIDDGLPSTGPVLTYKSDFYSGDACTTTDDPTTAAYDTTDDDKICTLIFITGY